MRRAASWTKPAARRAGCRDGLSATDRFQVLTGQFSGRQGSLLGRDEALEAAAQAEVGSYSRQLSKVLMRQREALAASDAPTKRAILFTDLQRSVTDVENLDQRHAGPHRDRAHPRQHTGQPEHR